jgi:hypothetical protein
VKLLSPKSPSCRIPEQVVCKERAEYHHSKLCDLRPSAISRFNAKEYLLGLSEVKTPRFREAFSFHGFHFSSSPDGKCPASSDRGFIRYRHTNCELLTFA